MWKILPLKLVTKINSSWTQTLFGPRHSTLAIRRSWSYS